ncbi:MAG: class I lanthipeptide [Bacteroidetes bacterium]|nr:class I lanthipeptide [Bacteroidota bacterium]
MKKSINKLQLNKSTISNLNLSELNQKIGGIKRTFVTLCCVKHTQLDTCTQNCPVK